MHCKILRYRDLSYKLNRDMIVAFVVEVPLTNGNGKLVYSQPGLGGSGWVVLVTDPNIRVSNLTAHGCDIFVHNGDGTPYAGASVWASGIVMTVW